VCVDLGSDPQHCGACATACAAGQVCVSGHCTTECLANQTNCNGTCVNTQTDFDNCGACGNPCPSGQTCSHGTCVTCPDCSSNPNGTLCVNGVCGCNFVSDCLTSVNTICSNHVCQIVG
jgi:Stigma-specific protein, Stig1